MDDNQFKCSGILKTGSPCPYQGKVLGKNGKHFCGIHAPGEECSICLDPQKASGRGSMQLNCKHAFHGRCLQKWIIKRPTRPVCPLCRSPIDPILINTLLPASINQMYQDNSGNQTSTIQHSTLTMGHDEAIAYLNELLSLSGGISSLSEQQLGDIMYTITIVS